ncbi:MAG TPA: ABC transporter permease [Blastocatellia bacterium]|nr:ABC transporter permease [Blastocatellia bacterium]
MNTFWQDLRYGFQVLRKTPGFTAVAVITIALGIGANTTIFSSMNTLVFEPFSFRDQERLVGVMERNLEVGIQRESIAPGNFIDWYEQNQTFDQLVAINQIYFDLTDADQPERFAGYRVSQGFFETLGVSAALGRTFLPEEQQTGNHRVVVLKHSLWQSRFGADPGIINQTITLNREPHTVVGVMPEEFNYPFNGGEMWTPHVFFPTDRTERAAHYLQAIGRLKPGVTIEQARQDLNRIAERAAQQFPETNAGRSVRVMSLTEDAARGARPYAPIVLAAVGFVLLIACTNVANLLLVRSSARQKEIAIRLAMGASRFRLIRQLMTESLLLALAGGALGLLMAVWGVEGLSTGIPESFSKFIPGWHKLEIDKTALVFTLIISIFTALLFGLLPALQATKVNLNEALKEGGKGYSGKSARNRTRSVLVVSEVALSMILLISAGLMIRSFIEVLRSDLGIDPNGVLTMQVALPFDKYSQPEQRTNFIQHLLSRVETLSGVTEAGAINHLPMGGSSQSGNLLSAGRTEFVKGKQPPIDYRVVTPGYFDAVGTQILKGRNFTGKESADGPRVVLIDEALAKRFFAGEEAIGQQLKFGIDGKTLEIIGITKNVMNDDFDNLAEPTIYAAYTQETFRGMFLVIHAGSDPGPLTSAVRSEVSNIDKTLPVFNVKPMRQVMNERLSPKRLSAFIFGILAVIALLLAAVGIYAVMSYAVSQRTHEIGIRMALGARPRNILQLVFKYGLTLTLIGLAIGLAGAFAVTRAMAQVLYGVTSTDALTFGGITLLLALIALLACYIPARRAMRVDPMVALRYE